MSTANEHGDKHGSFDVYKGLCVSPGSCRVAGKCLGPCEKIEARETPRTDSSYTGKWLVGDTNVEMVRADFARELERELAVSERKLSALSNVAQKPVAWRYRTQNSIFQWSMWTVVSEHPGPSEYTQEIVPLYEAASAPSTTPQKTVETPRTDEFVSVRRFHDDQAALDAWAAHARQLERDFNDAMSGAGKLYEKLKQAQSAASATPQKLTELQVVTAARDGYKQQAELSAGEVKRLTLNNGILEKRLADRLRLDGGS